MKIAMLYGRWCSGGPNAFDVSNLYSGKGLTGSESSFFNVARGLSERGHEVQVFCDAVQEIAASTQLGFADVYKLESAARINPAVDVVIAYNEPDLLRLVPQTALRVCAQQLNDLAYCAQGFDNFVDMYVLPSTTHLEYMVTECGVPRAKAVAIANSCNVEFFDGLEERRRHSVAYCSSPDRGLHCLLEWWPLIRKEVPDAELRIYYKVDPWLQSVRNLWYDHGLREWYEIGFRARYIEEAFRRIGRNGENGVTVVGPIPNREMARELMRTEVFAYPCDTVRWTEGFSVATLDACAAGCATLISDIDAIGDVHGMATHVIPGRPTSRDSAWIDAIINGMTDSKFQEDAKAKGIPHAARHSRESIASQWDEVLVSKLGQRKAAA